MTACSGRKVPARGWVAASVCCCRWAPARGGRMTIRTFLAVPLPDPLQEQVAALQRELQGQLPEVRWTPPANVHLTLRFFGATSADELEKIREVMLSIAFRAGAFSAAVRGLGVFPQRGAPRVLWLGVAAVQLSALHATCETALRVVGLPGEARAFTPHLTIGRLHRRPSHLGEVLALWGERPLAPLPVDRLVLYESRLLPGGARHLPILTAPLGNGPEEL
ncbi:MAG: RNA 2',3'-cyclic phosphodiesterase [Myxococcales bacterium]|nr:MAG: RNA 2',3'-cyclic phosphodiesterase [Myxococcales bacterium]